MRAARGQSMAEFALILPVLFLVIFGIVDFGRAIFYDIEISEATAEAARLAAGVGSTGMPTNASVLAKTQPAAPFVSLGPCPNGPVATPAPGQGYLYITEHPVPTSYEPSPAPNAPGGQVLSSGAGCDPAVAATSGDTLQVTIVYTFSPITPLIQQVVGNRIQLQSSSVIPVENAGGG